MSTEYKILPKVEIVESSSKFTLIVDEVFQSDRLTAEQVVDMAVKLLQPTLYNVEHPEKFFNEVILARVNKLFR